MYMRQILHPSIFYTHLIQFRVKGVTGACPSCHWARGVVRPWQVASNFQGQRKIYSCKKKKGRSFPNTKYPKNSNWTEWTTGPHPHVEWRSSETLVISLLLTSLIYHFLLVVCVLLHVLVRLTRQLEKGLRVNVSFLSFPVLLRNCAFLYCLTVLLAIPHFISVKIHRAGHKFRPEISAGSVSCRCCQLLQGQPGIENVHEQKAALLAHTISDGAGDKVTAAQLQLWRDAPAASLCWAIHLKVFKSGSGQFEEDNQFYCQFQ